MSTIVCGRSPFARSSVCPKAKRKTWVAIAAIYLAAAVVAAIAFSTSRAAHANPSVASRAQ